MKLKTAALVVLVFIAACATCFVFAMTDFQTGEKTDGLNWSPSIVQSGNHTVVTPVVEIDTPGGPT